MSAGAEGGKAAGSGSGVVAGVLFKAVSAYVFEIARTQIVIAREGPMLHGRICG